MTLLCPVCNGFYRLKLTCRCGSPLRDQGRLADFAGPYSPYEEGREGLVAGDSGPGETQGCVHLLSCPGCGRDQRVVIAPEQA
jgi:hypothetical protein